MAKAQFFPFFYVDFIHGTQFFTNATVGCYIRCLCVQWDQGYVEKDIFDAICDDLQTKERDQILAKFRRFRTKDVEGFQNHRMEETRKYVTKNSKKQFENGKLGGRPKQTQPITQPITQTEPNPNPNDNPNETIPNPNLNPNLNLNLNLNKKENTQKKVGVEKKQKPLTGWPWEPDFEPTEDMIGYAQKKGVVDPIDEFEAFKNWADQNEKQFRDWKAAWRTRCDNYAVFSGSKKSSTEGGFG